VADDENDQTATPQAFAVLYFIAARRMRRGRVTVVDSTNVRRADRQRVLWLAARYHRPAAAILFASPLEVCIAQNRARTERQVDPEAIRLQWERMPRSGAELAQEGFQATLVLRSSADAGSAVVTRAGPD
jgi:protein phosphatase